MALIPRIIEPQPDELLYSWQDRLSKINGFDYLYEFARTFIYPNCSTPKQRLDRRVSIDGREDFIPFAKAVGLTSLDSIIKLYLDMTIFPALVPIYTEMQQQDFLLTAVDGGGRSSFKRKLRPIFATLRYCPFCRQEDYEALGYSGCGKSSTIKLLLSRYPQVIIHSNGPNKLCRNPQIVYLLVNCSTNSNFNALYANIGHAIDTALGLTSNTYQDMISKKKGLGEKAAVVQNLIELFAIGIIILDEIQLIDFRSTKENSFEALMTLSNTTKVAFGIIGTEDAYAQMFTKLRTARRVGSPIIASRYCENRKFFTFLVRHLFNYQWFDEYYKPTNSLIDALYNDTHGIIDQLIELYIYMHIDYLSARPNERPIIDADFVHRTSKKHYKGLHELTAANTRKFEKELAKKESGTTIMEDLGLTLDEENQSKAANELMQQDREKQFAMRVLKKNIMQSVQKTGNYSDLEIMDAMEKVLRVSSNKEKSEEELTALVVRKLNPAARKKSTKKNKKLPTQDSMREYVMGTVPAPQN